ncbi:MAG: hypothetical protein IT357_09450 [Gemmatimonadaceae bacterium]|nr:hypothetical protein [Gemmatimonadaceae bacterium]
MLRRVLRSLGSLGALWTLVVLSSPVRLHACPEGHEAAATAMADHGGHGAHAGHGAIQSPDGLVADLSGDHSAVPSAGDCDCIDCCCATAPTAVTMATLVTVDASAWPRTIAANPVEASAPASAVPHRLPFANGPPGLIG